MEPERTFLGRGWSFPPTFNPAAKPPGVEMTVGLADIERSLQIILTTRLRERILAPNFGCDLHEFLFEPLDTTLQARIKDMVETAILYHEPRIKLLDVLTEEPDLNPGLLLIDVHYQVRSTNTRHNFVYPFYKNEGTEVPYSR